MSFGAGDQNVGILIGLPQHHVGGRAIDGRDVIENQHAVVAAHPRYRAGFRRTARSAESSEC